MRAASGAIPGQFQLWAQAHSRGSMCRLGAAEQFDTLRTTPSMHTRLFVALSLLLGGCSESVPRAPVVDMDADTSDTDASDGSVPGLDGDVEGGTAPWQPSGPVGHSNVSAGWLAPLTGRYDETNALFILRALEGGAVLDVQTEGDNVTVNIAASDDRFFVPGVYLGAVRYPFQSGVSPGLSLYGMARACNDVTGWFHVYELARNRVGVIERLRFDFVHDCNGHASQRSTGTVWWHATGVDDPVPAHPEDCAVDPHTGFCLASPAGDPIGRGRMIAPDRRDGAFTWAGDENALVVYFTGELTFGFRLSPVTGGSLEPGTYTNAGSVSTPTRPSMAVGDPVNDVADVVCPGIGQLIGSFEIHEIEWDGATLTRLSADVAQACAGHPAMYAKIRYTEEAPAP